MKFIKYPLLIINVMLVLIMFIAYLSSFISPEANQIVPIFGLFYPILFFLLVAFAIFWLLTKWTYSLISIAALLIGFSSAQRFMNFGTEQVIKSEQIIHVASYNLASGLSVRSKDREYFYSFLENNFGEGVAFFQESNSKIIEELRTRFPKHEIIKFKHKRAILMSKYPVIRSSFLNFENNSNVVIWADINFNGTTIRVYSVHLHSNGVTYLAEDVRSSGEIGDPKTWDRVKQMMSKYSDATSKRNQQLQSLLEDIERVNYPVIVGGDFNDVPQSYLYTSISDKLQDSFTEKGFGLGTSFNGSIPALRIDYIFSDKSLQVLNYKTHRVPYSDHFPITSNILIR